mmetsp:Transcript_17328/g.30538  ORF Transcript_17328/g.30538 Transcript_17328/m.30538 type:complete len:148 (-) Transcript_17328:155-598(-)|eukprot:CAMPEP_0184514912 /NCGR_PEP_ID=MMETSP0198_2-20121128/4218_1 /TAXON_ID=1112570 /ORGANISM="Thraustochytrium sp., Strain LLF1b" /LENGTH=147 /DNA_ID=CAMNT_0026905137 /DNA_START=94 /DNA_END=537 /DNA_ORIENTATION=-
MADQATEGQTHQARGNQQPPSSPENRGSDVVELPARADDGGKQWSAIDMLQEQWYLPFLGFGLFNIVQEGRRVKQSKLAIVKQMLVLIFTVLVSVKVERVLSKNIVSPLLAKLFGSNQEKRRRLEAEEARIRAALEEARQNVNAEKE